MESNQKIGIVGLGYVGLPLAVAFSKKFNVVGYDVSRNRIEELNDGQDSTKELQSSEFIDNDKIYFTYDKEQLSECLSLIHICRCRRRG